MAIKTVKLPSDQFHAGGYKTHPTPSFLFKIKKNLGEGARIGVIVGGSVHKTAVKRNFLKRQVLATIMPHVTPGSDILIIVLPGANRLTKKQFKEDLLGTFNKSQSLK
jgi:ribonuclease P protein component